MTPNLTVTEKIMSIIFVVTVFLDIVSPERAIAPAIIFLAMMIDYHLQRDAEP